MPITSKNNEVLQGNDDSHICDSLCKSNVDDAAFEVGSCGLGLYPSLGIK